MLSAARNHREATLSQRLADRMRMLFPEEKSSLNSAAVLLANTYLAVGNDQQAETVRLDRLRRFGKKVQIGVAWTEVNEEFTVRTFFLLSHAVFRCNRSSIAIGISCS